MEHLAFSASTKDNTNHNLVVFMESIDCEFGACNNAYISFDETVYKLLVPVDEVEILSTALHVLSEFNTKVCDLQVTTVKESLSNMMALPKFTTTYSLMESMIL